MKLVGLFGWFRISLLIMGAAQAVWAQEPTPCILSPHIVLEDNTAEKIALSWQVDPENHEEAQSVLLFVPGDIEQATASIKDFRWQAVIEGSKRSGTKANYPQKKLNQAPPRVNLRDMGKMAGSRVAVLELKFGPRYNYQAESLAFPQGRIEITFPARDDKPFKALPPALDAIAQKLFINYPPLRQVSSEGLALTTPRFERLEQALTRIRTRQAGVYEIQGRQILRAASQLIQIKNLALLHDQQAAAFQVINRSGQLKREGFLRADDALRFYAPVSQSPYSPEVHTWVVQNPKRQKFVPDLNLKTQLKVESRLRKVLHQEEDRYFLDPKGKNQEQAKYWFWHDLIADGSQSIALSLPENVQPATATLRLRLAVHPAYAYLATQALSLLWDNAPRPSLTAKQSEGIYTATALIPAQQVVPGTHQITISINPNHNSPSVDSLGVDWLQLGLLASPEPHSKPYRPLENVAFIPFSPQASAAWVVDASRGQAIGAAASAGEEQYIQVPKTNHPIEVYLLDDHTLLRSAKIDPVIPQAQRTLQPDQKKVDLVLVAPRQWLDTLRPYVRHLQEGAYTVHAAAVEDLYDAFGDGRLSPLSIRDYLRWLYAQGQQISYVFLVGDASWDYWNRYQTIARNYVPAYRENPDYAVENWFVRLDGDNPLHDAIVARWPFRNEEELETIVQKTIDYKTKPLVGSWLNHAFLLTDDGFEKFSDELDAEWLPQGFRRTRRHIADYPLIDNIYLPEALRASLRAKTSLQATDDIIDIVNQGIFLWEYFGHGAANVLGEERMFFGGGSQFSDVKRLSNQQKLPFLWGFTCETARFDYPKEKWNISIGEDLMAYPKGGIISLIGATGRGYPHEHILLARGLHEAAFGYRFTTLGQMFYAGKMLGWAKQRYFEPKDQFALLGDPTLEFPDFQEVSGELNNDENAYRAGWNVPDREIDNLWSQSPKDFAFENSRRISKEHARQNNLLQLGIEQIEQEGGRVRVKHGALSLPAPTPAPLVSQTTGRRADVVFVPDSLAFQPKAPKSGDTIYLTAKVKNTGTASATQVIIRAYRGEKETWNNQLLAKVGPRGARVERLDPGEEKTIQLRWDPINNTGRHDVKMKIEEYSGERPKAPDYLTGAIQVRQKPDLHVVESQVQLMPTTDSREELLLAIRNSGETTAENIMVQIRAKQRSKPQPIKFNLPRTFTVPPGETFSMGGIKFDSAIDWVEIEIDPHTMIDEETHQNNTYRFIPNEVLTP